MRALLLGFGIATLVFAPTATQAQTRIETDFVVLETPYVVSSDSPEPQYDEGDLPFLWLQERFWKAKTWDDMKEIYTPESIAWLESEGERSFYEESMETGWFGGEIAFPVYVSVKSGSQEVMLAQMVIGGESEVFFVRGVRKTGRTWRIDSLLETSALAEILATTPAENLGKELLSGDLQPSGGCTAQQLQQMKELGLSEEQIQAACSAGGE